MRKRITTLVACFLIMIPWYWLFVYSEPSERMMKLLDGHEDITIQHITVYSVDGAVLCSVSDTPGLEYFAHALRKPNREGFVPAHLPIGHNYAIMSLGTLHSVKIGIYADRNLKGFTIYYPYDDNRSSDPQYYWIVLDEPIPTSIRELFFHMRLGR
jgi:hypothetical protein